MQLNTIKTDLTKTNILYSDINLHVIENNQETLVKQADAINQNILVILATNFNSKWWRPRLGSNIERYLFEPMDQDTADKIKSEIFSTLIDNGEFRVNIQGVTVVPNYEEQYYYVELHYDVPSLNAKDIKFVFSAAA